MSNAALDDGFGVELVGKAEARADVSEMRSDVTESSASGAVAKLRCRSGYPVGRRVGPRFIWIEEHDQVVVLCERYLDIPANAEIQRELGSDLDVVLDVGRQSQVAQLQLLRVAAVGGVRQPQQEAGKGVAIVAEVGVGRVR